MSLAPGARLGAYEIVAPIGAGGMGEVYRATDTKLGRDVAIKILPEAFARDADRLARFQREAKTLASLNHPNIAAIYGIEESGGTRTLSWSSSKARICPCTSRAARWRWPTRGRSLRRSRRRWKPRTSRASFTAISSPRTSSCALMAK